MTSRIAVTPDLVLEPNLCGIILTTDSKRFIVDHIPRRALMRPQPRAPVPKYSCLGASRCAGPASVKRLEP